MGIQNVQRVLRRLQYQPLNPSCRGSSAHALRLLTTVASSEEHPSSWMRFVLRSTFAGLLGRLSCRLGVSTTARALRGSKAAAAGQTQVCCAPSSTSLDV